MGSGPGAGAEVSGLQNLVFIHILTENPPQLPQPFIRSCPSLPTLPAPPKPSRAAVTPREKRQRKGARGKISEDKSHLFVA